MELNRLTSLVSDFARAMTGLYDVTDLLQDLCSRAADLLDVDGAGIMLEDAEGELRFAVASDEFVRSIEKLQIVHAEGPCVDAFRTGEVIVVGHLESSGRYPNFGPPAVAIGMQGVYSFPVRSQRGRVGAMNLYTTRETDFDGGWSVVGQTLADLAGAILVNARNLHESAERADQLQHTLYSRVLVEQAKRLLVERHDISGEEAFERIHNHARPNNLTPQQVARRVLDGALRLEG